VAVLLLLLEWVWSTFAQLLPRFGFVNYVCVGFCFPGVASLDDELVFGCYVL